MTESFNWRCPVCGATLIQTGKSYKCPDGHCFDIAKSGYVNLLPPGRGVHGDDDEMITARHAFLGSGGYEPLCRALCECASELLRDCTHPLIIDAGCGECYYTAAVAEKIPSAGMLGVDLSKKALMLGGKRNSDLSLAVASVNALPINDSSADLVLSVFSPMARDEFYRTLKPGGFLLRVIPLARHLFEMKKVLYDEPYENIEERENPQGFEKLSEQKVAFEMELSRSDLASLFAMTPYYYRTGEAGRSRLNALSSLRVSAKFGIITYKKSPIHSNLPDADKKFSDKD